jgi:serine/threonine-protein kinase
LQEVERLNRASYDRGPVAQTPRPGADAGISVGQIFLGKYRVEAILGHGGMGVVTRCTHLGLNEQVAMKMLRQDVLLDRDATERFMREAQAASKLRSEHVARVVDVGTFQDTGVPYMVMEFLDGYDLDQLLEERGTIPAPWGSMLMLQAAEALAEAHSIGIVHRDVKPSNLFVTWRPDGSAIVKVLDFGISKAPSGTDMQLTQTQSLLGTPAYMSPEQMRSARLVDARTDIWSLGTVFYELLEGHRPFEADSFSEMCVKVAVDAPVPMAKAPPALQQVVLRCLAKSPDQRYASMAELGRDLIPFVQDMHQATLLVERMQRMLARRSPVDWEGQHTSGGGRRATPHPIRDAGSAAMVAAMNADTPLPRIATPAAGVPTAYTQPHESAPAHAPSEVIPVPRSNKLRWLIMAGFLCLGTVAGVLVMNRDDKSDPDVGDTKQTVAEPVTPPSESTQPAAQGSAATPDPVADPTPVPTRPVETDPEIDIEPPTKPAVRPAPPKKRPVRPPKRPVKVDKEPPPVKDPPPPKDPPCPIERRLPSGKGCAAP